MRLSLSSPIPDTDRLLDGRPILIRTLRPSDRAAVTALFETAPDVDLYQRFFTLGRGSARQHLHHLFDDPSHGFALVAVVSRHLCGVIDVEVSIPGREAEIALFVDAADQNIGVGTHLLRAAVAEAATRGITSLTASVLTANAVMLAVLRESGVERSVARDGSVTLVRLDCPRTPDDT